MENIGIPFNPPRWLAAFISSRPGRRLALAALSALFLTLPTRDAFCDPVRRALLQRNNPEYPALAKQMRIQGAVVLQIVIDPDGHVSDARLASGSDMLAEAAKVAVKKWKYEASPEPTVAFVRVVFSLD